MKTAEQIKNVIAKLENDLVAIRQKITELNDCWIRAGAVMENQEFLVANVDQRKELQKQEWQAEYRIRAYRWVLDIKDES